MPDEDIYASGKFLVKHMKKNFHREIFHNRHEIVSNNKHSDVMKWKEYRTYFVSFIALLCDRRESYICCLFIPAGFV